MMPQILFNHLFRHLSNWGAEISPRPKMSPPISLLQMRKFLKQPTCRIAIDPPHILAGCHIGWCTHQNMHMIFANHPRSLSVSRTSHTPDEPLLELVQQHPLSKPCSGILSPKQSVLNLKNRMAAIPVVHDTSQNVSFYQLKLTGWKPVVLTL